MIVLALNPEKHSKGPTLLVNGAFVCEGHDTTDQSLENGISVCLEIFRLPLDNPHLYLLEDYRALSDDIMT